MTILVSRPHEAVCLLTLNRPEKRNALNGAMIAEWTQCLQAIAADKAVRVVMLNGNGEHFCAGADIAWMQKMAQKSHEENVQDALQLAQLLHLINTLPKPVIGLLHGAVMGGGLGVTACCDIAIAADNATFCFSEAKMGLTPSVISPYVLPIIGERNARYYYLTAEKFSAQIAKELNLIQQIVPTTELLDAGLHRVKNLLLNSSHALSQAKSLIAKIMRTRDFPDVMQMTSQHLAMMRASSDAQEGLKAFLEKRSPKWESL